MSGSQLQTFPRPTRPRGPGSRAIRNGCVGLVLILLSAFAVADTVAGTNAKWDWEALGNVAPHAVFRALAQAAVGFAAAVLVHRLMPRAGLWMALALVGAALYAAALRWAQMERTAYAQHWMWVPFLTLLTLTALDAIPTILHEAAAVDRAGPWFKFHTITLPLVAPLVLGGVAFRIVDSFRPIDARRFIAAHVLLIGAIVAASLFTRGRR